MKTSNLVAETIKEAFGNSAEDVIAPISSASDVCGWLSAILVAIRTETRKKNPSSITIGCLADAAHYIAFDFENSTTVSTGICWTSSSRPASLLRRWVAMSDTQTIAEFSQELSNELAQLSAMLFMTYAGKPV
ncbi:MAG: hypothetical protein IPJ50_10285 [Betaproteobacteria bacterium]|nr:hypothetical protein [Betaproteobacteria bacterium]